MRDYFGKEQEDVTRRIIFKAQIREVLYLNRKEQNKKRTRVILTYSYVDFRSYSKHTLYSISVCEGLTLSICNLYGKYRRRQFYIRILY